MKLCILTCISLCLVGTISYSDAATVAPTPSVQPLNVFALKAPGSNYVCLLLQIEGELHVPYLKRNMTKVVNATAIVPLGLSNATLVTGNCSVSYNRTAGQQMRLSWRPSPMGAAWNLTLFVSRDAQTNKTFVNRMHLVYLREAGLFPGTVDVLKHSIAAIGAGGNQTVSLFEASVNRTFQCLAEDKQDFTEKATLHMRHVLLSAFRGNKTDMQFSGDRSTCPADTINHNIVPILVGSALALLIVAVFIAYLVGRKRAHAGYQTI